MIMSEEVRPVGKGRLPPNYLIPTSLGTWRCQMAKKENPIKVDVEERKKMLWRKVK